MQFNQLSVQHNKNGNLRTVGFELEFTNVGVEEAVQIIQQLYGGKVQEAHRFSQKVVDTTIGDFTVEFDLTLLTEKNYKKAFDKLHINLNEYKIGEDTLEDSVETMLESVVGKIFPYEIATPPVPCNELEQLEKLREALYAHHAKGTKDFITNAFGTHINVEVPDTEPRTLLNYLRAFLLLYPWLLEVGETDFARRVSPFIDPYPEAYAKVILAPTYEPDLETLIRDYHLYNPDRNRPLDMYPLFSALSKETVSEFQDVGKVKDRETFHYRLPNSSISQPDWTLAQEWNNWVVLDDLANEPDKIAKMSEEYLYLKDKSLLGFEGKWTKETAKWLT
ncbi:amidoligase family protein [Pontibacter akesuensis]|uniref:Putative amidoligase enzyme n=1 Tax=Pontibacter akesuensis TaxID=388950 RepID=A0A1I7FI43_9BACT|nr:amidoligase family protein [Pontibacter akesuensis]GHA62066.1 hypothetical protein GCM10007389_13390 [Pontibacter akesuensis]SFU35863.1 Putative amidoligase enzyme [Pontibacter akesuensis]